MNSDELITLVGGRHVEIVRVFGGKYVRGARAVTATN